MPDDQPSPQSPPPPATANEGLLSGSVVRLYGRVFTGLSVADLGILPGATSPLATALQSATALSLARIYAVWDQGSIRRLGQPVILLMTTPGKPIPPAPGAPADDLLTWDVDRMDQAVRVDVQTGTIDELLLPETAQESSRADLIGRDGNLIGRDGNLIGRDGNLIGR